MIHGQFIINPYPELTQFWVSLTKLPFGSFRGDQPAGKAAINYQATKKVRVALPTSASISLGWMKVKKLRFLQSEGVLHILFS